MAGKMKETINGRGLVTLPAGPFTQNPEYDLNLRRLMKSAIPAMLELARDTHPKALFLSGSAGWGEMAGVQRTDGLWFPLSDIDLSLIVEHRTADLNGHLKRELSRFFTTSRFAGKLTASPITVGTYALSDLCIQAPTLGVAEMRRAGCCLWGDASLLEQFPDPERDGLRPWEVIRLLLNRSMELLEACAAVDRAMDEEECDRWEESAWIREYLLAKMGSDLGTIILAADNCLLWGMERRLEVLEERVASGLLPGPFGAFLKESCRLRCVPTPPTPERRAEWERMEPLSEMLGWLHWTWDLLLEKYDLTMHPFLNAVFRWEEIGFRDRLRRLRRVLQSHNREIKRFRILSNWWRIRPAACFRSSLGAACLRYLLLLEPGENRWSRTGRENSSDLSPWVGRMDRLEPRSALQELGRWITWVRGVDG